MQIAFTKYQGLGNDFILLDNRHSAEPLLTPEQASKVCDRHFGIGADGVIFALPGLDGNDYTMRIYNSDGSEPEMCGNGIRCLAKFLYELEGKKDSKTTYKIHTKGGVITPTLTPDGQVTVDMGPPQLQADNIPTTLGTPQTQVINHPLEVTGQSWLVTCVNMGNPHCVIFVDSVQGIPLAKIGPVFEHHPVFPQRTNTEFIEVIQSNYIKMLVWERGAGATLACGTGACASVVAGVLNDQCDRHCRVELPGGILDIEWSAPVNRVYMTGPAEKVFTGTLC